MTSDQLLEALLSQGTHLRENAAQHFSPLTAHQLNWKYDHRQWSVGECLDHLNVSNSLYFPIVERALHSVSAKPEFRENTDNYQHTLTGNMMIKMVRADNRKKIEAPKIFHPAHSSHSEAVVQQFFSQHDHLLKLMESSKGLNLSRVKVYSPVSRVFKFNLGDCFAILIHHDERHFQQALRVTTQSHFPAE